MKTARLNLSGIALHLFLLCVMAVLLLPIAWMLSTSFKPIDEIFQTPPTWIPENPTVKGFVDGFNPVVIRLFLNSLVIAVLSTVVATFIGALTAYGISRINFVGKHLVLMLFLASLAFPLPLLMIAIYLGFSKIGLLDTYVAVAAGHIVLTIPIVIWILKDFFDSLPIEVEEAAIMDGAKPWFLLLRIVLPMAQPGLVAAAIFVFVTSWNEFVFGLTFISSPEKRPLPAGISLMFMEEFQYRWAELMAIAVLVTVPVLLLFLVFQKQFMRGVTAGAVKG